MSQKLNVVAVSGGLQRPSRTLALTEAIVTRLGEHVPIDLKLIELADIGAQLGAAFYSSQLPQNIRDDLTAIEQTDLLVVATPVYRGSYTGIFKHLFDLIDQHALENVPVLMAATGGSALHALVIEHQLRPLFSFFQALTLPIGVYASEDDFNNYQISSSALLKRINLAVERALPHLQHRHLCIEQETQLTTD